ncbi:hypothetical protein AAC387_Pa09g2262 [Persea americana]
MDLPNSVNLFFNCKLLIQLESNQQGEEAITTVHSGLLTKPSMLCLFVCLIQFCQCHLFGLLFSRVWQYLSRCSDLCLEYEAMQQLTTGCPSIPIG